MHSALASVGAALMLSLCGATSTPSAADLAGYEPRASGQGIETCNYAGKDQFSYLEDATDERTRRWIAQRNERMVAAIEMIHAFRSTFRSRATISTLRPPSRTLPRRLFFAMASFTRHGVIRDTRGESGDAHRCSSS